MAANPRPAVVPAENLNPYDFALRQFGRAADRLGLDAGTREVLSNPQHPYSILLKNAVLSPDDAGHNRLGAGHAETLERIAK